MKKIRSVWQPYIYGNAFNRLMEPVAVARKTSHDGTVNTFKTFQNVPTESISGYDGLSMIHLKSTPFQLIKSLTFIATQTLNIDIFPDKLMIGKVIKVSQNKHGSVFM